jgi:acetyl esterase/lipase
MDHFEAARNATMITAPTAAILAALLMTCGNTMAQNLEIAIQPDIAFGEHDGVKLIGDLYLPKGVARPPILVAVHGGGWQIGDRKFYTNWGTYLAKNGYAVFAIEYRLMKPGLKTYPGAVYDVRAAVQFVRAKAAELSVDPDRIALIGDSAGAHLSGLVALAGQEPAFSTEYRDDAYSSISPQVKAVVGVYGVYDMLAQWQHDQIGRPRDQISEKFLGASPAVNRKVFFEGSPISYATVDKNTTRFLLVYGTNDDIVDPATQSEPFLIALKQAQFVARTVVIPGAGHFWITEPLDPGSFGAYAGPRVLSFLKAWL